MKKLFLWIIGIALPVKCMAELSTEEKILYFEYAYGCWERCLEGKDTTFVDGNKDKLINALSEMVNLELPENWRPVLSVFAAPQASISDSPVLPPSVVPPPPPPPGMPPPPPPPPGALSFALKPSEAAAQAFLTSGGLSFDLFGRHVVVKTFDQYDSTMGTYVRGLAEMRNKFFAVYASFFAKLHKSFEDLLNELCKREDKNRMKFNGTLFQKIYSFYKNNDVAIDNAINAFWQNIQIGKLSTFEGCIKKIKTDAQKLVDWINSITFWPENLRSKDARRYLENSLIPQDTMKAFRCFASAMGDLSILNEEKLTQADLNKLQTDYEINKFQYKDQFFQYISEKYVMDFVASQGSPLNESEKYVKMLIYSKNLPSVNWERASLIRKLFAETFYNQTKRDDFLEEQKSSNRGSIIESVAEKIKQRQYAYREQLVPDIQAVLKEINKLKSTSIQKSYDWKLLLFELYYDLPSMAHEEGRELQLQKSLPFIDWTDEDLVKSEYEKSFPNKSKIQDFLREQQNLPIDFVGEMVKKVSQALKDPQKLVSEIEDFLGLINRKDEKDNYFFSAEERCYWKLLLLGTYYNLPLEIANERIVKIKESDTVTESMVLFLRAPESESVFWGDLSVLRSNLIVYFGDKTTDQARELEWGNFCRNVKSLEGSFGNEETFKKVHRLLKFLSAQKIKKQDFNVRMFGKKAHMAHFVGGVNLPKAEIKKACERMKADFSKDKSSNDVNLNVNIAACFPEKPVSFDEMFSRYYTEKRKLQNEARGKNEKKHFRDIYTPLAMSDPSEFEGSQKSDEVSKSFSEKSDSFEKSDSEQIDSLQNRLCEAKRLLAKQRDEYEKSLEEIARLERRLGSIQEKSEKKDEALQRLEEEIEKLRSIIARLQKTNGDLEKDNSVLRKENDSLLAENDSLKHRSEPKATIIGGGSTIIRANDEAEQALRSEVEQMHEALAAKDLELHKKNDEIQIQTDTSVTLQKKLMEYENKENRSKKDSVDVFGSQTDDIKEQEMQLKIIREELIEREEAQNKLKAELNEKAKLLDEREKTVKAKEDGFATMPNGYATEKILPNSITFGDDENEEKKPFDEAKGAEAKGNKDSSDAPMLKNFENPNAKKGISAVVPGKKESLPGVTEKEQKNNDAGSSIDVAIPVIPGNSDVTTTPVLKQVPDIQKRLNARRRGNIRRIETVSTSVR